MGVGHRPQGGGHVGPTVTVAFLKGQHVREHPTGTVVVGRTDGQTSLGQKGGSKRIGHPMKPERVTVTVGQAGAMMVV